MSKSSVAKPCARRVSLFSRGRVSIFLMLLLAVPAAASATQIEVSRLATELNQVSSALATELKNSRGYGSVRFSADRLSRAAADLVRAIRRNRSGSFLRSEFQDVARHYRELEEAFLRSGREHNLYVYSQVGLISNLFSGLNSEFYYTNYVEPAPQVFIYSPLIISRHSLPPAHSGRSVDPSLPADKRDTGELRPPPDSGSSAPRMLEKFVPVPEPYLKSRASRVQRSMIPPSPTKSSSTDWMKQACGCGRS